ncbi:MAG TPA: DUF4190 domain-containing protein [Pseudolysinimonas sp.]|jgi:hypothetical protein
MAVCANCSRELQPEWKFCIYCGAPTGVPVAAPTPDVLRAEDIPADEPTPPESLPTAPAVRVNILAVLALILGCLVSPLAALFGHLALNQISRTGERGTAIAWVAIVLGYLSLAALLVLGISYLVLNA